MNLLSYQVISSSSHRMKHGVDKYAPDNKDMNERVFKSINDLRAKLRSSSHDFEAEIRILDSVQVRVKKLIWEMRAEVSELYYDIEAFDTAVADPQTPLDVSDFLWKMAEAQYSATEDLEKGFVCLLSELENIARAEQTMDLCQNEQGVLEQEVRGRDECGICLAPYLDEPTPAIPDPRNIMRMACHHTHTFHVRCMFEWLKLDDRCPYCRAVVFECI